MVSRQYTVVARHGPIVLPGMVWTYNLAVKIANVAEFKNHLSEYLAAVANGEQVEVRKRNMPLARVVPIRQPGRILRLSARQDRLVNLSTSP